MVELLPLLIITSMVFAANWQLMAGVALVLCGCERKAAPIGHRPRPSSAHR